MKRLTFLLFFVCCGFTLFSADMTYIGKDSNGVCSKYVKFTKAMDADSELLQGIAHDTDLANWVDTLRGEISGMAGLVVDTPWNESNWTSVDSAPSQYSTQAALLTRASASALSSHESDTDNPHEVTATQLSLGNVDNTSDLNKPVSTATQNALDSKLDTTAFSLPITGSLIQVGTGAVAGNSVVTAVAVGYNAVCGDFGVALGTSSNANSNTASTETTPKMAIGYNTINDQKGPSCVIRGDLYLSQGTHIYTRPAHTGSYSNTLTTDITGNVSGTASNVTGVVDITHGGTNASNVLDAKTNFDLENVDNTSDTDKPVSTATQNALNLKLNANAFVLPLTGTTVAIGTGANADSPDVAVGVNSNGYSSGVAMGGYANAATSAVAIGTGSNSNSYGTALGYQSTATTGGAAVGHQSRGGSYGVAVGQYANGYYNGAAIGRKANGYYYGIAIGREANANVTSESTADSPKTAIGYGANNDQAGPSTVIRGNLYLTQCSGIYARSEMSGAYIPGGIIPDSTSAPDTMSSPGVPYQVIFKNDYMYRKMSSGSWKRIQFQTW